MSEQQHRNRRTLAGTVVSNKMNKTIVVKVDRRYRHRKVGKYVTRSKHYYAHDEDNKCNIGDVVLIVEASPLSRLKRWRLREIQRTAQG
jgi:small subunit ribosomal protein S17